MRDKDHNNIYHLAADKDWTEKMTEIVLSADKRYKKEEAEDARKPTIFSLSESKTIKSRMTSTIASCYSSVFPYYLWPSILPHPTALDSENIRGDTPLIKAAELGRKNLVQIMLENGADVNKNNRRGRTALYKTIAYHTQDSKDERHEIVKLLLEKGATVTGHIENHTLLHTAVQKNSLKIVELLAEPETKEKLLLIGEKSSDNEAETALQMSVRLGFEDIAKFLIEAKTNKPWNSTLQEIVKTVYPAVQAGHVKILTILMEKGNLIFWHIL